jgi:hypothetical protein
MAAFCDMAWCSLLEADRSIGGAYCLHHQGEVCTAFFIDRRPAETLKRSLRLKDSIHGVITQNSVIFILASLGT